MKRARPYAIDRARAAKRRRIARGPRTPKIIPGYTRKVGFYGRFNRKAGAGPSEEKKFFDTSLIFNFDLTGEIPLGGQLCLIPQGDTESTRDGRKAIIKSIQIRGIVGFAPGVTVNSAATAFMYLVLDTQCNGAAAGITDVFTSSNMATNLLQLNNSGRFRILKRWVWPLNSMAGVSTLYGPIEKSLEFYKKCNIPIDWNSTTGALTEIRSNNIFIMAGSTQDDLPTFGGVCRLRFYG